MSQFPSGFQRRSESRLDELLVRYWAKSLSPDEEVELAQLLERDEFAEERLEAFCLQTLVASELAVARPVINLSSRRRSRLRWLAVGPALAAAACVAVFFLGVFSPKTTTAEVTPVLVRSTGTVRVHNESASRLATEGLPLERGQTISTVGLDASAILTYPDGTAVLLTGDTVATITEAGYDPQLLLRRGAVSAEVATVPSRSSFRLATSEGVALADGGSKLSLSRTSDQTEVSVTGGRVRLINTSSDSWMNVKTGEIATLVSRGETEIHNAHPSLDHYTWNLSQPLPKGWELGRLLDDPSARPFGRSVVPVLWNDRFIHRTCWQIRSNNRYTQGLFYIYPESRFRVRYKVDRSGTGQLLIVIRQEPMVSHVGNVLLASIPFEPTQNGEWRTVELTTADWEVEKNIRRLPPGPFPWLAYLVVFNTYEHDLGLKVAEFTVSRGELPALAN